jgi:hypothetical protein
VSCRGSFIDRFKFDSRRSPDDQFWTEPNVQPVWGAKGRLEESVTAEDGALCAAWNLPIAADRRRRPEPNSFSRIQNRLRREEDLAHTHH